jgi:hypothetical protein
LRKKLLISIIFGCIGITTEIFFTAFYDLISLRLNGESVVDFSLAGKTYVWMFFIYALIPFFISKLFPPKSKLSMLGKSAIGMLVIFAVEFVSGWLLEQFTGKCPWEYQEGWHVAGYIRLDFAPAWFLFAWMVLWIYNVLNHRLSEF